MVAALKARCECDEQLITRKRTREDAGLSDRRANRAKRREVQVSDEELTSYLSKVIPDAKVHQSEEAEETDVKVVVVGSGIKDFATHQREIKDTVELFKVKVVTCLNYDDPKKNRVALWARKKAACAFEKKCQEFYAVVDGLKGPEGLLMQLDLYKQKVEAIKGKFDGLDALWKEAAVKFSEKREELTKLIEPAKK
jgi:hypothetical protein